MGKDKKSKKKDKKNKRKLHEYCDIRLEREVNESLWYYIMKDNYRYGSEPYENEVFAIKPYSWDDYEGEWNFWHKPSGFKLSWYKYPLRTPYANIELTHEEFYAVLIDCMNSVPESKNFIDNTHLDYMWWKKA